MEESKHSEQVYNESVDSTVKQSHIELSDSSSSDNICIVKPVAQREDTQEFKP